MKTASAPNSSARLITTSMSNKRYRRIDTPIASGINANDRITRFWSTREPARVVLSAPGAGATRTSRRRRATPRTRGREQPPQLESLDAARPPEPQHERRQRTDHPDGDHEDQGLRGAQERTRAPRCPAGSAPSGTGDSPSEPDRAGSTKKITTSATAERPREPSPPRRRQMPVREQQEQERDGQHDDRDPARLVERDRARAPVSRLARVDQVVAERGERSPSAPKNVPIPSISQPIEFSGRRVAST